MKIILGASTRAVRAVDGVVGWKCWCYHVEREREKDERAYWISEGVGGRGEQERWKKEKARQREEGRQVDRFCRRSRSRVGIEETDNLSLFDKLWVLPPPLPPPPLLFLLSHLSLSRSPLSCLVFLLLFLLLPPCFLFCFHLSLTHRERPTELTCRCESQDFCQKPSCVNLRRNWLRSSDESPCVCISCHEIASRPGCLPSARDSSILSLFICNFDRSSSRRCSLAIGAVEKKLSCIQQNCLIKMFGSSNQILCFVFNCYC